MLKELIDPSVEKVHGWDITGMVKSNMGPTQNQTQQSKQPPWRPCKAPLASHSMAKQAPENFFEVFYQGCEMHLHLHPPSSASPSSTDINSDHCRFPPAPGEAEPEVQIKEGAQVRSVPQRDKRLLTSPSDVCFRLIQIFLRGQQEIRGTSRDTFHSVPVVRALWSGVESGPV